MQILFASVSYHARSCGFEVNYEYIPTLSGSEEIVFLDTTPVRKTYSNAVDVLKPAYDYDKEQVVFVKIG